MWQADLYGLPGLSQIAWAYTMALIPAGFRHLIALGGWKDAMFLSLS